MAFVKGQSGNPGGRPETRYIKDLARARTTEALDTLAEVLKDKEAPHAARVSAANSLLDRGWGKPAQAIVGGDEDDPAVRLITEIRTTIVDPKAST
jgi:hypothetical protein